ncbi:MAG TPA: hypothetical protein VE710_12610 [Candidatus Bathyarchaeia archaeon]|nr:hypothetical protein [Candidatus Bathyarchaeia archaeon]
MSWVRSMGMALLIIVIGYLGVLVGIQLGKHDNTFVAKELERDQDQEQSVGTALPLAPAPDHDRLLQAFRSTDDKGWRIEYTAMEIAAMRTVEENKDYKKVLERYISKQLGKQLVTFQTVSRQVNPREVLVTTTDRNAYLLQMEKWNKANGIWAVTGANQMVMDTQGNTYFVAPYRSLEIAQAPADVEKWANQLLASPEARQDYLRSGRKTYVFLKTTNSSHTDSVEIEEVFAQVNEVHISYQSLEVGAEDNPLLINEYILLEIDYAADAGVTFTESIRAPS